MKKIRLWAQPIGDTELTTTLTDEVWQTYQDRLDNGETIDNIYQELVGEYHFEVGMTKLLPFWEAFDVEVSDCDCEDSKKRPIQRKEETDGSGGE